MSIVTLTIMFGVFAVFFPLTVFAVNGWRKLNKKPGVSVPTFLILYCLIVIYGTLIDRHIRSFPRVELKPFWSYRYLVDTGIRWQIYMNLILFVPIGFLSSYTGRSTIWVIILCGACFSVCIELLQYLFRAGLCETDDVIHNTLGTTVGCLYYQFAKKHKGTVIKTYASLKTSLNRFFRTKEKMDMKPIALNQTEQQVLALLRQSITGETTQLTGPVNEVELIRMISHNCIILTLYPSLGSIAELASVKERLKKQFASSVAHAIQQDKLAGTVLSAFANAGITCIPLKGIVMRSLYPKRIQREMGDLDILIKNYHYKQVCTILESIGFKGKGSSSWKHDDFIKDSFLVEAHKRLTDDSGSIQTWEKSIWNRIYSKNNVYYMSDEDFFIFHIVHMNKDFLNGTLGLRRIADTWLLMQREMDWAHINNEFAKMNMVSFADRMMHLARVCFNQEEMDDDSALLLHHACSNGIYGSEKTRKVSRIANMSEGNMAAGKIRSVLAAVFLPVGRMKAHFPILHKYPFLLPICWIRRICHHVRYIPEYVQTLDYSKISLDDYQYIKRLFKAGGVR